MTGRAIREGRRSTWRRSLPTTTTSPPFPVWRRSSPCAQAEYGLVGLLNVETVRQLPAQASRLVRKVAIALGPAVAELRAARRLDVAALAQLFVYQSSVRDPLAIAEISAASLSRILSLETVQLFVRAEDGGLEQFALSRGGDGAPEPLPAGSVERLLESSDQSAPLVVVDVRDELAAELAGRTRPAPSSCRSARTGTTSACSWGRAGSRGPTKRRTPTWPRCSAPTRRLRSTRRSRSGVSGGARSPARITGLLNRRGFEQLLDDGIAEARETRRPLSLLVVDCDDFKEINDRAGHQFGDALLAEIGRILPTVIPFGAGAARLGGDEFVVMLRATEGEAADAAARRCDQPGGRPRLERLPVRLSAGLSTYPYDGGAASQAARRRPGAVQAKAAGKDRHAAYRDVVRQGAGLAPTTQPAGRQQRRDAQCWRTPGRLRSQSGASRRSTASSTASAAR